MKSNYLPTFNLIYNYSYFPHLNELRINDPDKSNSNDNTTC